MIGLRVPITADELEEAERFCCEFRKLKPYPICGEYVESELQLAGKLGEIVAAKLFKATVNFGVFSGADLYDFKIDDQMVSVRSIQVNRNMNHDYQLIWRTHETMPDIFIQVLIAPDRTYGLVTGYISKQDFLERCRKQESWGHVGKSRWATDNTPLVVSRWVLKGIEGLLKSTMPAPAVQGSLF